LVARDAEGAGDMTVIRRRHGPVPAAPVTLPDRRPGIPNPARDA
jgi:hypothetical protein